ncbi:MAG: hypothetical protein Q9188_006536 [Gyalolechia gomerana]
MSKRALRKGFHDLPSEIRNQIYAYSSPSVAVLSFINGEIAILERVGTEVWYTIRSLPILHLDTKTRAEATAFLHDQCTFAAVLRPGLLGFEVFFGKLARQSTREWLNPQPMPHIRNWLIDLKWDTQQVGNGQPCDFKKMLESIVNVLYNNESTVTVTVKYPCNCCFLWGGFMVLDTDVYGNPVTRMTTGTEGHKAVFDMLEPLAKLPVSKKVDFVPTVFVKTRFPPYYEYSCEKDQCHQVSEAIGEIMMAKGNGIDDPPVWFRRSGRTVDALAHVRADFEFH